MTAARCTWAIYVLFHVCVIVCAHGGELREGVLTVTLANGTQAALKYQVPKGQQNTAPGPSGAAGANAVCCIPLVGEVAWYDSFRYSLYNTPNCQPSSRVCNIPGKVQSAWVCGCSGGDCSGEHTITAQTPVLPAPADAVATLSEVSTQQLHKHQGMPTRITVFLASQPGSMAGTDGAAGECALQGFKVEYVQGAAAIGPAGASQAKVVLGTGLKKDSVVAVLFQKQGSCVSYLMMRTRSGRSAQAGSMNPVLELHTASAPAGSEGLAALHGFTQQQDTTTPGAPAGALQSLNLLWGVSQCSTHASGIRRAKVAAQETLPVQPSGAQAAMSAAPADAAPVSVKQGLGRRARFAQWAPGALTAVQAAPRWRAAASAAAQAVAGRVAAVKDALDKAASGKRPGDETQVSIASLPRAAGAAPAPKWAPLLAQLGKQAGFSNRPAASVHGQLRSGGHVQPARGDPSAAAGAQVEPSSQQTPLSDAATAAAGPEAAQPVVGELPAGGNMQSSSSPSSPDTATPAAQEGQATQQTQAPVGDAAAAGSLPSADSAPTGLAAAQPSEPEKQTAAAGGQEDAAQQGGSDALDVPHTQESTTAKPFAAYSDNSPANRSDTEGPGLVSSESNTASSNSATETPDVHISDGSSSSGTSAGTVTPAPTSATTSPGTGPEPAGPDAQPELPSQPNLGQDGSSIEVKSSSSTSGSQDSLPSPKHRSPNGKFPSCRLSDPFCFTDEECYCQLSNGTFGAACPVYGSCLGACCATTGTCPTRMGYEDPQTGQQAVLLPSTCGDWGLNEAETLPTPAAAAAAAGASSLECKLPKNRECALGTAGYACMGYTTCEGGDCGAVQDLGGSAAVGAMCVYKEGNSTHFDVCSCLPVY